MANPCSGHRTTTDHLRTDRYQRSWHNPSEYGGGVALRVLYVAVMMSWCRMTESERLVPPNDFEAVFVNEAGVEQRVPWWRLPDVVGELGRAVRSSPSFRGRRSFPGLVLGFDVGWAGRVRVLGSAGSLGGAGL